MAPICNRIPLFNIYGIPSAIIRIGSSDGLDGISERRGGIIDFVPMAIPHLRSEKKNPSHLK